MCMCTFCTSILEKRITRTSGTGGREKEEVSCNRDRKFTKDIIQANSPNQANATQREVSVHTSTYPRVYFQRMNRGN